MAEVKFDVVDAEKYVHDHYLSVRVGEAQKLSKMTSTRAFKFPASAIGSRKYGKVEVYKRVGTSTFCIDPSMAKGMHEVQMVLDDASTICMSAVVNGSGPLSPKKAVLGGEVPTAKEKSAYQQSVTDYLDETHLEVRLSDAMQAVIRERPKDPAARLAEILSRNADKVARLPVLAKAPIVDVPADTKVKVHTAAQPLPILSSGSFASYYGDIFRSQPDLDGLHAKFRQVRAESAAMHSAREEFQAAHPDRLAPQQIASGAIDHVCSQPVAGENLANAQQSQAAAALPDLGQGAGEGLAEAAEQSHAAAAVPQAQPERGANDLEELRASFKALFLRGSMEDHELTDALSELQQSARGREELRTRARDFFIRGCADGVVAQNTSGGEDTGAASFSAYYQQHFRSVAPSDLECLHNKFAAARSTSRPSTDSKPTPRKVKKSTIGSFAAYYPKHFRSVSPSDLQGLYSAFVVARPGTL